MEQSAGYLKNEEGKIIAYPNAAHLASDEERYLFLNGLFKTIDGHYSGKNNFFYNTLRVGGDPEFFAVTNSQNQMRPAFNLLNTTFNDKRKMWGPENNFVNISLLDAIEYPYGFFYQDGYQFEIAFMPRTCIAYSADVFQSTLKHLYTFLSKSNCHIGHHTVKKITPKTIEKYGEVPLGCRPCDNAYGDDTFISDPNPLYRFTGGHFHFGVCNHIDLLGRNLGGAEGVEDANQIISSLNMSVISEESRAKIHKTIKMLDCTLGLLSVAVGKGIDSPLRRKYMYGRAGDYRLNPLTLEYRTPSSVMWLHPVLFHMAANIGRFVYRIVRENKNPFTNISDSLNQEVKHIINSTDAEAAAHLIENSKEIKALLMNGVEYHNVGLLNTMTKQGLIDTYGTDIYSNWKIGGGWAMHSESPDSCMKWSKYR